MQNDNVFYGGIPAEWGALTNLKELRMVACELQGAHVMIRHTRTHATNIALSSGDVPHEVFVLLGKLNVFDLSGNPKINAKTLIGHLSCNLSNLKNATTIDASNEELQGTRDVN